MGKADKLRLARWDEEKFEGFWPKKAREHPQGKVNFPLRMIPWLSPDAKHPGWRLRRRARSTMIPIQSSAFLPASAGTKLFSNSSSLRYCGSRGIIPLVQVHEGRTGPRFVVTLCNKPVMMIENAKKKLRSGPYSSLRTRTGRWSGYRRRWKWPRAQRPARRRRPSAAP